MVAQSQAAASPVAGSQDGLLRRALTGNVLFSAVAGSLLIAGSGWISDVTGLSPGWVPALIGAGVLLWAVEVAYIVRRPEISSGTAWLAIAGDLAWVAVSYGAIISGRPALTAASAWTVGILAEVVAAFAVVQYFGLRRMRRQGGS